MKKYGFPIWLSVIAIVLISFIVVFAFHYHDNQALKSYKTTEQKHLDSLTHENAALRKALSEKLVSYCDTMSVDQKLAQQKLDDYTVKMYDIKEAQEIKAYKQKESAGMKAYKQKESADLKAFDTYWKTQSQLLTELEKKDSKTFLDYAVISFRQEKHNGTYNYGQRLSSQKERIEKIPVVAEFIKADKNAWNLRTEAGKKLEQEYSKNNANIDSEYQSKLKTIGENYEKKIAVKKIELGL